MKNFATFHVVVHFINVTECTLSTVLLIHFLKSCFRSFSWWKEGKYEQQTTHLTTQQSSTKVPSTTYLLAFVHIHQLLKNIWQQWREQLGVTRTLLWSTSLKSLYCCFQQELCNFKKLNYHTNITCKYVADNKHHVKEFHQQWYNTSSP